MSLYLLMILKNYLDRIRGINNKWFFTELPWSLKALSFFIKGDLLVLFPVVAILLLIGFFSFRFMFLMIGVYIAIRQLGEMIYWFSHQFYDRTYRPPDWGFKNLDNHAIYILHQTASMAGTVFGLGIICYILLYYY